MSVYSGKCDVYDHFSMRAETDEDIEKEIQRTDFYIYLKDRKHKLDIHTVKDLIPYYPFLTSAYAYNKEGKSNMFLSSESFVDQEEKQFLNMYMDDVKKYYRKCKRLKQPFNKEEAIKKIHWNDNWEVEEYKLAIVDRVAKEGQKANIDGLFIPYKDWERTRLYDTMVEYGYDENYAYNWCFKEYSPNKERLRR